MHPLFEQHLAKLVSQVEALQARDPLDYRDQSATKLLATINRYIREIISRDPNAAEVRQGNTLGAGNRHLFRTKFHERYRLFYRFSIKEKVIIYVWVNDEDTLRKAGSKTVPYVAFRSMLGAGNSPGTMAESLAAFIELDAGVRHKQTEPKSRNRRP